MAALRKERTKTTNQQDLANYSGGDLLWRNVYWLMTLKLTE
jgi:hypothetical protein